MAAMEGHRHGDRVNQLPEYILNDLCSRFILNMGPNLGDHMRIMFEMEAAHWYYKDFITKKTTEKLPSLGLKEFARQMYEAVGTCVEKPKNGFDAMYEEWTKYKFGIPTFGGILIDPDLKHCLMVQHFSNKTSWGFPKGKRNEDETPEKCAIREVLEETGFDCSDLLNPDDFFNATKKLNGNAKLERLYPVAGVPLNTKFQTRTREEIKSINWFEIDSLPTHKDQNSANKSDYNPAWFHTAFPFINQLKKWIKKEKRSKQSQQWRYTQRQGATAEADRRQQHYQRQQQLYTQGNQSEYQDYLALMQRNASGQRKLDWAEGADRGRQGGMMEGGDRGNKQRKMEAAEGPEKNSRQRRGAGGEGVEWDSQQRGGHRGDSRGREPLLPRPHVAPSAPVPQVQIMQRGRSAQPNRGDYQANLPNPDSRLQGRRSAGQQQGADSDKPKQSDSDRHMPPQSDSRTGLLQQYPIPRCKAWDSFKLDVDAIMAAFGLPIKQ